jgi:hypothetical protein
MTSCSCGFGLFSRSPAADPLQTQTDSTAPSAAYTYATPAHIGTPGNTQVAGVPYHSVISVQHSTWGCSKLWHGEVAYAWPGLATATAITCNMLLPCTPCTLRRAMSTKPTLHDCRDLSVHGRVSRCTLTAMMPNTTSISMRMICVTCIALLNGPFLCIGCTGVRMTGAGDQHPVTAPRNPIAACCGKH